MVPRCGLHAALNRTMRSPLMLTLAMQVLVANVVGVRGAHIYQVFDDATPLLHQTVDATTGNVYMGGVNKLYQLDEDLSVISTVITGPLNDSEYCLASGSCSVSRVPTDNYNKVVVINYAAGELLACGSVYQGRCVRHHLSDINRTIDSDPTAVVANTPDASTVAFVAPGIVDPKLNKVLYVAATITKGPYRDQVPSVASRSLQSHNMFALVEKGISQTSSVVLQKSVRDRFSVDYVTGFYTEGFSYFVQVQPHSVTDVDQILLSKISRVCDHDLSYSSYTEVELQCVDSDGKNYRLVHAATLATPGDELARSMGIQAEKGMIAAVFTNVSVHGRRTVSSSALCLFPMKKVQGMFRENIEMCYNGTVHSRKLEHINMPNNNHCPTSSNKVIDDTFCGERFYSHFEGTVPLRATAVITFDKVNLTSVAMSTTGPYTVVFAGTSDGYLKKIFVKSGTEAREYEKVPVDPGQQVLRDMKFDRDDQYLYVMSSTRISKVKVQECDLYQDCDECSVGSGDPYCGWCTLENRCSLRTSCSNANTTNRWISVNVHECIEFSSVIPSSIPVTNTNKVELRVNRLPRTARGYGYTCVFGTAEPIQAEVLKNVPGLLCDTPPMDQLAMFAGNEDHFSVPLYIRSTETGFNFVSHMFTFYNCSAHTTCLSCVDSRWGCSWCVYSNKCTDNPDKCASSNPGELLISDTNQCPRFIVPEFTDYLLPSGLSKSVTLLASNLPTLRPGDSSYECVLQVAGSQERQTTPAEIIQIPGTNNQTIVCNARAYGYKDAKGEISATLSVVWNNNHHVDFTSIKLYKCSELGRDCSICLTRPDRYRCAWCGGTCSYGDSCLGQVRNSCPGPEIFDFSPKAGPVEGGTLVTVWGSNLLMQPSDIVNATYIAGIACRVEQDYDISTRFVCRTGYTRNEKEGPVAVSRRGVKRMLEAVSTQKFRYLDPQLVQITPLIGPRSGGTRLNITGRNLHIGSEVTAMLDELHCHVEKERMSTNHMSCVTSAAPSDVRMPYFTSSFTISFDAAERRLLRQFTYTEDPNITSISPLRSFYSGGRRLTVRGTYLTSIQMPKIFAIYNNRKSEEMPCTVINVTLMYCPSPSLPVGSRIRRELIVMETAELGFIMDDVASVQNLSRTNPNLNTNLLYVPNPVYKPFAEPDNTKLYRGDSLIIEGDNLNLASGTSDVIVTVGNAPCNVTSLAQTQLVCTAPQHQPPGVDEYGRETNRILPMVRVRVGNLDFPIGFLQYEVVEPYKLPEYAIGAIAACGGFLVLVILVILFVYRRKSSQAEREYKRIQIQMDTLESNVRSECKQAFAELQTDMTDLTKDLVSTGIPFLDHRTYVMKVFFPGIHDHPILRRPMRESRRSNFDTAMLQFEQLLNYRSFLLVLINALEEQKTFTIRDKVNVASLLMIALSNKLDYATEIMKALLQSLISKSVDKKHPQLMLRRTESVVEKMLTNWMALCMYNYMREYAGRPLFMLYKAIKHQVEKGPIDYITNDARYSLSEDRLLLEKVDHSVLTLNLVQGDCNEYLQVRVLDIDTVSQAKMKILDALYKNTPFSLRPSIHEIDLEWRHGRGGHLILMDEDVTSEASSGWRRINTLKHYNVPDNAIMALVPRASEINGKLTINGSHNYHNSTLNHLHSIGFPKSLTQPILQVDEEKARIYHLVRPVDDHLPQSHKDKQSMKTCMSEIFLTRLLATKGTIQKFTDDFFATVLSANKVLPLTIKYLFDFLDEEALRHQLCDPDVVYAWKSNSLPLRFWVNFIKNPDFVFDIHKTNAVDSSLSVIAQTFMDSCSTSDHRLGKDSPSNKLLYAKDIPRYKAMVNRFYQEIQELAPVSDQEMNAHLGEISRVYGEEFNSFAAVSELYGYIVKYHEAILDALEDDQICQKMHLARKLETVAMILEDGGSIPI